MTGCCAKGCMNSDTKGFRMFKIPLDEEKRQEWLEKINRKNWFPGSGAALCEVHFDNNMFEYMNGMMRLKKTAVPTIFAEQNVFMTSRHNILSLDNIQMNEEQHMITSTDICNSEPVTNPTIDYIVINSIEDIVGIAKQLPIQNDTVKRCRKNKRSFNVCNVANPTELSTTLISLKQPKYI